jgi:hypothetical protein
MRIKVFKAKKFIAFIPCINLNVWDTSYTLEIGWLNYFINIGINKLKTH